MPTRRYFIKQSVFTAASFLATHPLLNAASEFIPEKLTILHTNDVHSRLDPFPADAGVNAGKGGIAARAALINNIRKEGNPVLLVDAGDIFQGTPYFNLYKGEPEIKAMAMMGYEASIMGNHDFDAGLENFASQVSAHANFPIVMCNYDFSSTPMESRHLPYKIIRKGNLKIGILGVGIELMGLVPENLFGNTKYLDPVQEANKMAYLLTKQKNCDFIICLSHLGNRYRDSKVSDEKLAKESEYIDLIIGGHTHTFLEAPIVYKNKKGEDVIVNQVGWAGINLGRLDFEFSKFSGKKLSKSSSITITKKTGQ
jgi:5'-nucleotidase